MTIPFQKINPNVPGPRNVKSKGSSRQFSRIGSSKSLRHSKGKENDPPKHTVIANDVPKATTATSTPPTEYPILDLSFLNDTPTTGTATKYDPLYIYKLTGLHDAPLRKEDFIGGSPLFYARSTSHLSSTDGSITPFILRTTPKEIHTITASIWRECAMSKPPMQQCNTLLIDPPTTIRTSNGSLSFPFNMEVPAAQAGKQPPPVSTPAPPASVPYQPYDMYLDATKANPMLGSGEHAFKGGNEFQRYTREDCVRLIRSSARKPTKKSAAQAASVLSWMAHKFNNGSIELQPDGACFNWCMHAFAELGEPEKAGDIMNLMFHSFQYGNGAAEPNVRCFTCLLHAWRKSFSIDAPERCDQLIDVMQDLVDRHHMKQCQPDSFSLSVVMQCWVESGRKDAAEHVEKAFHCISASSYVPDEICVSLLLSAYSKDLAIEKAESLLSDVIDDLVKGVSPVQPRTRNFNTLLAMYARMGTHEAPLKAENLVSRFRSLANRGVLAAKPDVYTYSQLLRCWVRSGRQDSIDQATTCFFWMKDLAENGETAAAPDCVKYNTIITAFIREGEVEQAVTFFKLQLADVENGKECQPDIAICESIINACASYGGLYLRAGQPLLKLMWNLHDCGHLLVAPRFATYKKLVWTSITAKQPRRAFVLLNEMQSKKVTTNSIYLRKMYQAALSACKHLPSPQGASLSYHIRTSMNILFPQHLPTK